MKYCTPFLQKEFGTKWLINLFHLLFHSFHPSSLAHVQLHHNCQDLSVSMMEIRKEEWKMKWIVTKSGHCTC